MRLERIESLVTHGVSLDLETHRIQLGLLAPPPVCGSAGWLETGPRFTGALLDKEQALDAFKRVLLDDHAILVGANIAFDLLVVAMEFARRGIDAMPWIFKAFEEQRVYDLQIAEALHAIANGHLGKDPRTGMPLKDPETGGKASYRLAVCVDLNLGRQDAKANDEWRLKYAELDGIPLELWPPAARDYPVDDARNTHETALAQTGHVPKTTPEHNWTKVETDDGKSFNVCRDCGSTRYSAQCMTRRKHRNLHEVANQTYSAFCLHAGAAWGFHVDQAAVDKIERYALWRREKLIGPFIEAGIIRTDGSENRKVLKRLVALGYGSHEPCPHCKGTGEMPHPEQPTLQCPECKGRCVPWKGGGKINAPTVAHCTRCANQGRVPHPVVKLTGCAGPGDEVTCDGTGLLLTEDVPRAKKDGIQFGRDPLIESGDDFLMSYGYYLEDAKVLKDYVPYLREPRVQDHVTGIWRDVPLTLRPNAVLATGRVSYRGYVQLMPRAPGFIVKDKTCPFYGDYIPSLRECIVARGPRMEVVEVPEGYVLQPGEEIVLW